MTKSNYNYCQKCHKWLGYWTWLEFWERKKLCQTCQEKQENPQIDIF